MHFSLTALVLLLVSTALAEPQGSGRHGKGKDSADIFPDFNRYSDWAICKGQITKTRFPKLQAPNNNGGCVRYYQGIDMTGVVTEQHIFFPKVKNACDCAAKCLERPKTCTNWVWKNIFDRKRDGGKRSCTLYSSPNLPTGVTLKYNLGQSKGFQALSDDNNPQMGGAAPFTFLDKNMKKRDRFGVSGFITQDPDGGQYC
ncbi:hypothetical protein FALCPG4_006998 [Fusarium falciforme]